MAILLLNGQHAEFIDSFGKSPEHIELKSFVTINVINYVWIKNRFQDCNSKYCGLYVLYFILMQMCFHVFLDDMCSDFTIDFVKNDEFVSVFIHFMFA